MYLPASEVLRESNWRDNTEGLVRIGSTLISSSDNELLSDETYLFQVISGETISLSTTDTLHTNSNDSPIPGFNDDLLTVTTGLGRSKERNTYQINAHEILYCYVDYYYYVSLPSTSILVEALLDALAT